MKMNNIIPATIITCLFITVGLIFVSKNKIEYYKELAKEDSAYYHYKPVQQASYEFIIEMERYISEEDSLTYYSMDYSIMADTDTMWRVCVQYIDGTGLQHCAAHTDFVTAIRKTQLLNDLPQVHID